MRADNCPTIRGPVSFARGLASSDGIILPEGKKGLCNGMVTSRGIRGEGVRAGSEVLVRQPAQQLGVIGDAVLAPLGRPGARPVDQLQVIALPDLAALAVAGRGDAQHAAVVPPGPVEAGRAEV